VTSPAVTAALGDLGEFALIDAITADAPAGPQVRIGPGDDAAVLELSGPVLASVDVLVEGVHFRRDWSGPGDVGRKAVAVNLADLEAMGGRAVAVVVGFSAPPELPAAWALDCAAGMRAECAATGVSLAGGDVTRARDITISVTALGVLDGADPVLRSGAGPGQVVAMAGRIGWAAAGLVVLGRGFRSPRAVVEAQRVPAVPYGEGARAARAGATAMVDVSDGLVADLGHLARASAIVVDLRRDALEVPEPLQAVGAATGTDPYTLMLTGGEDHALAACFPDRGCVPSGWAVIGTTRDPGEGGPGVLVDGEPWTAAAGFDHFRTGRR
jgi:thiamine-monophosphate kinase